MCYVLLRAVVFCYVLLCAIMCCYVLLCSVMCCYLLLCSVMCYYYVLLFAVGVGDNIYRKRHERGGATTNEACNVWDLICLKGTNRQSSC